LHYGGPRLLLDGRLERGAIGRNAVGINFVTAAVIALDAAARIGLSNLAAQRTRRLGAGRYQAGGLVTFHSSLVRRPPNSAVVE